MPVAFVISSDEAKIVGAIPANAEGWPKIESGLFKFRPVDVRAFIGAVQEYASVMDYGSDEWHASLRLQGRLGSWMGQQIVDDRQMDFFQRDSPRALIEKTWPVLVEQKPNEGRETLLRSISARSKSVAATD